MRDSAQDVCASTCRWQREKDLTVKAARAAQCGVNAVRPVGVRGWEKEGGEGSVCVEEWEEQGIDTDTPASSRQKHGIAEASLTQEAWQASALFEPPQCNVSVIAVSSVPHMQYGETGVSPLGSHHWGLTILRQGGWWW
eukprot:scaffold71255_cov23-Tisochrysis_lutea.AAC.6